MRRLIPKTKIKELRFGQLMINALCQAGYLKQEWSDDTIKYQVSKLDLFYIENDELEHILQEYLDQTSEFVEPYKKTVDKGQPS